MLQRKRFKHNKYEDCGNVKFGRHSGNPSGHKRRCILIQDMDSGSVVPTVSAGLRAVHIHTFVWSTTLSPLFPNASLTGPPFKLLCLLEAVNAIVASGLGATSKKFHKSLSVYFDTDGEGGSGNEVHVPVSF